MDEATLKRWQSLHLRFACGKPLTAEEQTFYEAGCAELDATETIYTDREATARLERQIVELEAENRRLVAYRRELEAKLAELEAGKHQAKPELVGGRG